MKAFTLRALGYQWPTVWFAVSLLVLVVGLVSGPGDTTGPVNPPLL